MSQSRRGRKRKIKRKLSPIAKVIIAIIIIFLSTIGAFEMGLFGRVLSGLTRLFFGQYPIVIFVSIILLSIRYILLKKGLKLPLYHQISVVSLIISLCTFLVIFSNPNLKGFNYFSYYLTQIGKIISFEVSAQGGIIGAIFYSLFSWLFDHIGSMIFSTILFIVSIVLLFYPQANKAQERLWEKEKRMKFKPIDFSKLRNIFPKRKPIVYEEDSFEEFEEEFDETVYDEVTEIKPTKSSIFIDADKSEIKKINIKPIISQESQPKEKQIMTNMTSLEESEEVKPINQVYQFPPVSLLDRPKAIGNKGANSNSAQSKGERLISILGQFGIPATLVETHIGPAVTKFELKLDSGVKVSKINSLQDNIMMELAVTEIRIEAPIPGKNAIGIEIPNVETTPVRLFELLENVPVPYRNEPLMIALGKNLMGKNVYGLINKMPHLLVAGATGSGKSVGINSMISTLLMHSKPSEVKLLLIDPKKVEFQVYRGIPHLIADVINDPVSAAKALVEIVKLMDERYEQFAKYGAKNLANYNEIAKNHDNLATMPYIVVIIDELADLMMVAGKEVESSIQRITQLARAAGIHLIVATQRPSVDVITGVIKSNIPSRIAFAVSSATDSRTILDGTGAERLLGYGDMLYLPFGEPNVTRVQGVFISDQEVTKITEFAKKQGTPVYMDRFSNLKGEQNPNDEGSSGLSGDDPLYEEVKLYVIEQQKASTSLLQRRFGIGYNRAARIIDSLEDNGVIGPIQGAKPRDVYIKPSDLMDQESDEETEIK